MKPSFRLLVLVTLKRLLEREDPRLTWSVAETRKKEDAPLLQQLNDAIEEVKTEQE